MSSPTVRRLMLGGGRARFGGRTPIGAVYLAETDPQDPIERTSGGCAGVDWSVGRGGGSPSQRTEQVVGMGEVSEQGVPGGSPGPFRGRAVTRGHPRVHQVKADSPTTATSSWRLPFGRRTTSMSLTCRLGRAPRHDLADLPRRGVSNNPSLPSSRVPPVRGTRKETDIAAPSRATASSAGGRQGMAVIGVMSQASESPTLAPQIMPGVTAKATAVVSPGRGSGRSSGPSPRGTSSRFVPDRAVRAAADEGFEPPDDEIGGVIAVGTAAGPVGDGDDQSRGGLDDRHSVLKHGVVRLQLGGVGDGDHAG